MGGSAWLFDNWANGTPSLGWGETSAFLILPVVLVISQFLSMEIMTPKEQKDTQPAFLKVLPLMIGWFSLNVPSALCVYWVTNNIVTTASSVIIRNSLKMEPVAMASASTTAAAPSPQSNVFNPPTIREKPSGFASSSAAQSRDGVAPITSSVGAIDAEVVEDSIEVDDSVQAIETAEPRTKKAAWIEEKEEEKKELELGENM